MYCIHVSGHDPLTFSFLFFSFLIGSEFYGPNYLVLKPVRWAHSVPFPPVSLQRQVVCLLLWPVFMCSSQGRASTSDLWLFTHASNLLPHPTPLHMHFYFSKEQTMKENQPACQHTDLGVGGVQGSRCPRLFWTWPPGPLFLQLPLCSPECCQVCCPTWHAHHHGSNPLWRSPPPQSSLDCPAHLETNINPSHSSYMSQPPPPPTSHEVNTTATTKHEVTATTTTNQPWCYHHHQPAMRLLPPPPPTSHKVNASTTRTNQPWGYCHHHHPPTMMLPPPSPPTSHDVTATTNQPWFYRHHHHQPAMMLLPPPPPTSHESTATTTTTTTTTTTNQLCYNHQHKSVMLLQPQSPPPTSHEVTATTTNQPWCYKWCYSDNH